MPRKGVFFAFLTAFVSGFSIFLNKFAVGVISPPIVLTGVKNFLVALTILAVLLATSKWKKIRQLNKKELLYLLLVGLIGGSIPFYLFFTGLSQVNAVNAALVHKTQVIWVSLLAVPILKEKLTRAQSLAILGLYTLNFFLGGFEGFKYSSGELMILVATLLWAVETIISKHFLKTVDPDFVVTAIMGLGSITLLTTLLITQPGTLQTSLASTDLNSWFLILLTAVALFAYQTTWYRALKYAPAITASVILVFSTVITNILSAVFLTHTWNASIATQSAVIMLCVGVFIFSDNKKLALSI